MEKYNLSGYWQNYLFASYVNNIETLDEGIVYTFVEWGLDINASTDNYSTGHNNALSFSAQHRRYDNIKNIIRK